MRKRFSAAAVVLDGDLIPSRPAVEQELEGDATRGQGNFFSLNKIYKY